MAEVRRPVQKRSRERVEKILLAAADELAKVSKVEDLTTTSVSRRAGVPVSTLYRYFTDRSEIIAALIDREIVELDSQIRERLEALDEVTMDSLFREIMYGHWQFFRSSRRAVLGWFGARGSKAVLERVNQRYVDLGDWIVDGSVEARFVDRPVPEWGGEAILWICDRVFEFVFREERTEAEQKGIIDVCIAMLSRQFREYSSAAELVTVDQETFWAAFGPYDPPPPHPGER